MKQLVKVFLWGAAISFLGSLPPGVLNVAATQLSVENGVNTAFVFAFGAMIVELVYVFFTLRALNWVSRRIKLFRLLEWFTIVLILALSINSLNAAINTEKISSVIPANTVNAFLGGILLSSLNPLHIIFWFGWSTILIEKNILCNNSSSYNFYTSGIGFGTMSGFAVFIFGGSYIIQQFLFNQTLINWAVGIVLLVTAIVQLYKIRKKPLRKLASGVVSGTL